MDGSLHGGNASSGARRALSSEGTAFPLKCQTPLIHSILVQHLLMRQDAPEAESATLQGDKMDKDRQAQRNSNSGQMSLREKVNRLVF